MAAGQGRVITYAVVGGDPSVITEEDRKNVEAIHRRIWTTSARFVPLPVGSTNLDVIIVITDSNRGSPALLKLKDVIRAREYVVVKDGEENFGEHFIPLLGPSWKESVVECWAARTPGTCIDWNRNESRFQVALCLTRLIGF